jgi:L,D-transpeptidase ErfK/SrfK
MKAAALALLLAAAPAPTAPVELAPVLGVSRAVVVARGDTLLDVAERARVGFGQVVQLNPGVDVWIPEPGTRVALPTEFILPEAPRTGLVINLPEMRLYEWHGGIDAPAVYAIAIGDAEDPTPEGEWKVGNKRLDPYWYVPDSIREENPNLPPVVPPGPENPLGDRWLTLGQSTYGIHGTNNIWSIGRLATHGCIRLYNDDMRALYARTKIGTRITIVYQTVKIGLRGDDVYLEAHPDVYARVPHALQSTLVKLSVLDVLGVVDGASIEELDVERVITEARGVPIRIGRARTDGAPRAGVLPRAALAEPAR